MNIYKITESSYNIIKLADVCVHQKITKLKP